MSRFPYHGDPGVLPDYFVSINSRFPSTDEIKKEHLLIIFDYERPDAILENLKRRFPYVEITYLQTKGGTGDATKTSKFDADVDLPALYKSATILCTLSDLPKKPEDAPK